MMFYRVAIKCLILRQFIFLFGLFVFVTSIVCAQSELHFDTQNCTAFSHGISKVTVIDQRIDSGMSVGFIRDGKLNSKQKLLAKPSLSYLLEEYYTQLSARSGFKSNQHLVVLIHQFSAREDNTGFSEETARFFFTADYFLSDNAGKSYQLLGIVNDVVFVNSLDVTQLFLKTIDRSLCSFYEGLYKQPNAVSARNYSFDEIVNFKEEQKKNFKAYCADSFKNAYYILWEDFLMLRSKSNEELIKKGNRYRVATTYIDGRVGYGSIPSDAKIIAFDNQLFYKCNNKKHLIYKIGNDFFIKGYVAYEYWSYNGVIQKNMRYYESLGNSKPLIEGDLPKKFYGIYEFKIEPRTGSLIPIRKIKKL